MKIINLLLRSLVCVLFTSADPNLFGSRKRRKEKEGLAKEMRADADRTQEEIDLLKSENPFESAAAKSAMATSARNSKQMAQRYANMMGANASPEAMIAAQGATQGAVAGAAGQIAVGAEANKANQIAQLRGEKNAQLGQSYQTQQSAIDERGSGWTTFFSGLSSLGGLASGVGQVGSLFTGSGKGASQSSGGQIMAGADPNLLA